MQAEQEITYRARKQGEFQELVTDESLREICEDLNKHDFIAWKEYNPRPGQGRKVVDHLFYIDNGKLILGFFIESKGYSKTTKVNKKRFKEKILDKFERDEFEDEHGKVIKIAVIVGHIHFNSKQLAKLKEMKIHLILLPELVLPSIDSKKLSEYIDAIKAGIIDLAREYSILDSLVIPYKIHLIDENQLIFVREGRCHMFDLRKLVTGSIIYLDDDNPISFFRYLVGARGLRRIISPYSARSLDPRVKPRNRKIHNSLYEVEIGIRKS